MTTTQDSKCSREVTYDFGSKTARCGACVNGRPLLCDCCRTPAATANHGPINTVRSVCEEALQKEQNALDSVLTLRSHHAESLERCDAEAAATRARIADLQTFLAAQ
ncbi:MULTISPECIES: hypothetical protein [unclassified Acidovorax]|uniref:hypothetical protein n=1 Tax=unclassified Acidovorax TaxID=2684926 RepID=UPI001C47D5D7|nr:MULTISPECIES: hypothetical protein [unclassified Acidovorax]MBV7428060.1 hypothetical protein [Acidovorax sp. sif0732]MBV7449317.1 hypothetical protein [Acidovorax sp. sif0715]